MRELLLLTALFITAFGRKTFEGDQVLRITARNDLQINLLKKLTTHEHFELDFWMEPRHQSLPVDVRVPLRSLKAFKDFLKDSDIQYEIMIQNLQDLLDEEQREMMRSRALQPRNTDEFDYGNYHTLDEIYNFIDMLEKENPDVVSKFQIGKSYEGRPLIVLNFTKGPGRPGIWIDAGIHSREWISHASATFFAKKIVSVHNMNPALKSILEKCDIFLEIVVNPDGYVYTHQSGAEKRFWRKSRRPIKGSKCVGVDLNRNWNARFGGEGSSNDPCHDTYHGPSAHSEPEVKAIVDFVNKHGKLKAFMSIHSYSQLLLYPYGYTDSPCKDHAELDELAKNATTELKTHFNTKYTYGSSITLYKSSGTSIDWAYNQGIKYSYTFELRPDHNSCYGFLLPANQIIHTAGETWLAIMAIMEHTVNHLY